MSKPTPTTHGSWRVIDGKLVNEAGIPVEQVVRPVVASADERIGGPGIPVPPVDAPNTPQTTPPRASRARAGSKVAPITHEE